MKINDDNIGGIHDLLGELQVAQRLRIGRSRSNTSKITRSTALAVIVHRSQRILEPLMELGYSEENFLEILGFSFPLDFEPIADADIHESFRQAISAYVDADDAVLEPTNEVLAIAILESAVKASPDNKSADNEPEYELEGRLQRIGVDMDRLREQLRSRSLPFDPRRSGDANDAMRRDDVPTHDDLAATVDLLDRKPFAELLAKKIHDLVTKDKTETVSLAVHLNGPWGSGKSSILNFMRDWLKSKDNGKEPWIVIDFNAWENERIDPPWWPLIKAVYAGATRQLISIDPERALWIWLWWHYKQFRAVWGPYLLSAAVIGLFWWLFLFVFGGDSTNVLQGTVQSDQQANPKPFTLQDLAKLASLIILIFGTLVGAGRVLLFGSTKAANLYLELSTDPLNPVTGLFNSLVSRIRQPIAIFIDDLDRCNKDYVVKLLEGVQTMFRGRTVVYVVAADRKWITTSFEDHYGEFVDPIGEDGRPLGYLFLEKIFQISVSVPGMDKGRKERFWEGLVNNKVAADNKSVNEEEIQKLQDEQQKAADKIVANAGNAGIEKRLDELNSARGESADKEAEYQAFKIAVANNLSTSQIEQRRAEHQLTRFSGVLPENPRFMKRMINAYGLHRAIGILSDKRLTEDTVARWTIIEQRWPALAEHLIDHPDDVQHLRKERSTANTPSVLKPFVGISDITHVINDGEIEALNVQQIRDIAGNTGI